MTGAVTVLDLDTAADVESAVAPSTFAARKPPSGAPPNGPIITMDHPILNTVIVESLPRPVLFALMTPPALVLALVALNRMFPTGLVM